LGEAEDDAGDGWKFVKCYAEQGTGIFGCKKWRHVACARLDKVPNGQWICSECRDAFIEMGFPWPRTGAGLDFPIVLDGYRERKPAALPRDKENKQAPLEQPVAVTKAQSGDSSSGAGLKNNTEKLTDPAKKKKTSPAKNEKKNRGKKNQKEKPSKKRLTPYQRISRDSCNFLKDATLLFIYNDKDDDEKDEGGLAMSRAKAKIVTAHAKDNDAVIQAYNEFGVSAIPDFNCDLAKKLNLMTLQGIKDFIRYDQLLEDEASDDAFVSQYEKAYENRALNCEKVIKTEEEGETRRVHCLNKFCAPYIFEKTKEAVAKELGDDIEEMSIALLSYSSLFNIILLEKRLQSEKKLPTHTPVNVIERLISRFGDVLFFPDPDDLPTGPSFWKRITDLQAREKNVHIYPPLSHLLSLVDPVNHWLKDLQKKENPGVVNDYLLKTFLSSDTPTEFWATQSWNVFFTVAVAELVEFNSKRPEWGENPLCSEEHMMQNGIVLKMYGNRVARGGESVYLLIPKQDDSGTGCQDPMIAELFNICDLSSVLNDSDGVFPTPFALIEKTQGPKLRGRTSTAYCKIEAWMDGYQQDSETHNYGRINGEAIAKIGTVYHKRGMDGKLRAEKVGPFPRKLVDKIGVAGRDSDKAFTAQVYEVMEEAGLEMHRHLPIRIDAVIEKRFGNKGAKIGTLTSWKIFPCLTMENVTNANSYIIQESASSIVDFVLYHLGNDSWPRVKRS